jgi:hypothetical protein
MKMELRQCDCCGTPLDKDDIVFPGTLQIPKTEKEKIDAEENSEPQGFFSILGSGSSEYHTLNYELCSNCAKAFCKTLWIIDKKIKEALK